ncbi:hypothetical protein [Aerococcus viridans]|uniref:Uncharacterized protein n=1 Tax=Aerococcus viridans TaxID=1377 RepID=A0A2J9PKI7_9LACT|nr:hypothetical protein [Aerococcus viridans]PNL90873.1 hypothetical protein A6J77_000755 [Aerococcus viridans]
MENQIKVVMIPDNSRVVINYGTDNDKDFNIGTEIVVYEPGPDIKDPDTNNVIDQYAIVKEKLTITEVYENYAVARNEKIMAMPSLATAIASPMLKNRQQKKYETINVNEEENLHLNLENPIISIGDLIRIVD